MIYCNSWDTITLITHHINDILPAELVCFSHSLFLPRGRGSGIVAKGTECDPYFDKWATFSSAGPAIRTEKG